MQNWFNCKVKYQKIDEHGKQVRVSESYLVEAINFTEAETRTFEIMTQYAGGDIVVSGINKANFSEIINYEQGQYWFKAKVSLDDYDESSGKLTKVNQYFLVAANSVKQCFERIEENLSGMQVEFDIPAIALSPILDVFPLFDNAEQEQEIPQNLKPLASFEKVEEEEWTENEEETNPEEEVEN
jgi:hypothetical protein